MDQELTSRLEALKIKYSASGQELLDFLDGLLEADYITYWDYIRLDSLLSLQQPRTPHHDESIFIGTFMDSPTVTFVCVRYVFLTNFSRTFLEI